MAASDLADQLDLDIPERSLLDKSIVEKPKPYALGRVKGDPVPCCLRAYVLAPASRGEAAACSAKSPIRLNPEPNKTGRRKPCFYRGSIPVPKLTLCKKALGGNGPGPLPGEFPICSCRENKQSIMATMRGIQLVTVAAGLTAVLLMPCRSAGQTFALDSTKGLQPRDVTVDAATYQGRKAVRVMPDPASAVKTASGGGIVVLPGATFHNGIIELEVAGKPGAGAPGDARGFVGVAFRVSNDASKYECFYLRPTNGRADDQLRRNHSAQYISFPDYEWNRLRTEAPGSTSRMWIWFLASGRRSRSK